MTKYLFLDGNCLRSSVRHVSERYCSGEPLSLNWWGPAHGYQKIFYYDAIPVQKTGECPEDFAARRKPVVDLHAYLSTVDRFRVNEGDTRYRSGRGQEQKKVDVMIAVDMMIHTIRRNMDACGLLAGDVDFKPLLDALVNEGMFVTLIYPPGRTSMELLAAADARRAMTVRQLHDWLDGQSQARLGLPEHTRRSEENAARNPVLSEWVDDKFGRVRVIWEPVSEALQVEFRIEQDNTFENLTSRDWKKLRLLAEDDFGLKLPEQEPS